MKRIVIGIIGLGLIVIGASILSPDSAEVINVQAAASMQNALTEIEQNFEEQGYDVQINYGGSGTLVTQIQEGAPADIFISAAMTNFDTLKATNPMVEDAVLTTNNLVLIANKDSDVTQLADADTIAIGTPSSVPAGMYATEVIDSLGLTTQLSDKIVQTKDVTEVLTYVETGDADLGFVYNTDALASDKIKVVATYDERYHDPIEYPIGLLTDNSSAKVFYDYLNSDEALEIFEKYGFGNDE